ncbi:MAG TPA: hypothetical protein VLT83_03260 [Opitutaceae bacterium]|nr:hypothetical protein [Opitutaceae bacterium]
MKTTTNFILGTLFLVAAAVSAVAQEFVPGKVYVSQITGGATFVAGGKAIDLKKGDTQPAQGARIDTAAGASLILVYSNGTGVFIDERTAKEIRRFVQRPFASGVDTATIEPSSSDTLVSLTQGRVIVVTNELATGTSMVYVTPHAQVRIRGKVVVIEVRDQETRVTVVSGDATVIALNAGPGGVGQLLHTGQMAVVTGSSAAAGAELIQVATADPSVLNGWAGQIAATERAQTTVLFETVNPAGGRPSEIQAKAVVPAELPVPLTVSPSTLRTGG